MNAPEKLAKKRSQLAVRTAQSLHITENAAIDLLSLERCSSFRINRLKVDDDLSLLAELADAGWRGVQSPFYDDGYSIREGRSAVVDSPAARDGRIFIQNQASWLPVLALDPLPGEIILDMCAAPGGKATHIAELTDNKAELWVNDNSRARLFKLRSNFERLSAHYSRQTMYTVDRLPHVLEVASFDKILLDAPCSGEGLLNYQRDKDFEYWSVAQIKRLQQLQKKAIKAAWKLLKPGGTLVYSTCTMAPDENEAVVNHLLTRHQEAAIQSLEVKLENSYPAILSWNGKQFRPELSACLRLAPSPLVEAFFVAKITKQL